MDINQLISDTFIKHVKCAICKNYLSFFPIYVTADNQSICGRCQVPKESSYVQNEIYEIISKDIRFPCRYINQGCIQKLFPKEISEHEAHCPVRIVKCPANKIDLCKENLSLLDVVEHCESEHSEHILKKGDFVVDLMTTKTSDHIFMQNEHVFIFRKAFDCDNKKLSCAVYSFEENLPSNEYVLCLENNSKTVTVTGTTSISPDVSDCNNMCFEILKNGTSVEGNLSLSNQKSDGPIELKGKLAQDLIKLLELKKCLFCSNYILPESVYAYKLHPDVLCSSCVPFFCLDSAFETCRIKRLTEQLIDSCENYIEGCPYTSRSSLLKKHQPVCWYRYWTCPFSASKYCTWEGFGKEVIPHVLEVHGKQIVSFSRFSTRVGGIRHSNGPTSYLIKFSGLYFRVSFAVKSRNFYFTVQMLGNSENAFKYELEVVDQNKNSRALVRTQLCSHLTAENELFCEKNEFSYFYPNQLKSAVCNENLMFNVRIFK